MRFLAMIFVVCTLALPASAANCPSASAVLKALGNGFQTFNSRGQRLDDDPVGMIRSAKAMGYMDEASPDSSLNNKYPENVSASWRATPNWRSNITLKRGIFGDGGVYVGANITYGGQITCIYDFTEVSGFSDVSGLKDDFLKIDGYGSACVPGQLSNWRVRLPSNGSAAQVAAQCRGRSQNACPVLCGN